MSKITKVISALALSTMMVTSLVGCSGGNNEGASSGDTITVNFWTAPQKVQYDFWTNKAEAFNATNTKVGDKVVKLEVQQMPETPSSEAGIQNALATGTAPAISENINRGFATTLAQSEAVYSLENEDWFKDIVKNRALESVMPGWEIEGSQYVIPMYVNPMVLQWNTKALKELGFDKAPETKAEFDSVITKFNENKDKMSAIGVTHVFYRNSLIRPDQWWDRSSDFQNIYLAFSGGKSWVEGNKLVLDKEIAKESFEFFGSLGNTLLTSEVPNIWAEENPQVLFTIAAPWEIQALREGGKVYGENYTYGPMIVKNQGDTPYNYADAKGLVLYKADNITDEIHQGAIEFMKWLYNEENSAKTDLEWLEATTMLPVRGDLLENEEFSKYLAENEELKALAGQVEYAIPGMPHDKMAQIQEALGNSLAAYLETTLSSDALTVTDATKYVDEAFDAMKQAGGLE
ncbi:MULTISPECIES: ABC transporter substrate-binding protein [Clostridium]|jgi:multiple sugar transport system substrate-binding protein|uniref:ABC transporter substrate-binding protein n=1 Tax=Clostridium TaxID=1485 RepID=UPI000DCFBE57|nr:MULTISPECIES: ABC transporter substrate-binding protein [Clostridium]MBS5305989.1 carbohydrate ABC transporter substrate-binding protein [Clostridium sp.]MBU6134219.1 ABC transporter substrate-binding protein [Clostridium tertium]MDB1969799.1 ABC transporter substrate-binding protein [Clostridium tertium]MDU1278052.1 ABC transporter substrate-binding protein [Clostridium sp.]MDU2155214.1 ABC transporter substrate-binding protein [Clostridium sp.]